MPSASPCDTDTNKCNGTGTCDGATCRIDPKTVIDAKDADLCTDDLCDPLTGTVTNPPSVKPSDSTLCTLVTCDPATGLKKTTDLSADANPCTYDECNLGSGPINTPIPTGDGDPCTVDSCDPTTGVVKHTKIAGCLGCKTDADCDDGDPCSKDSCKIGICERVMAPDGASCDNGNACDGVAKCNKGKCVNSAPPAIDDDNNCTKDRCDPETGQVTHDPVPGCQPN